MSREIDGFVLENEAKLHRAIQGTVTRNGQLSGGVGEEATNEAILAEYDKLGGYITKDGVKVKMGSFYDFKAKCPRKEPDLSFITEIDGEMIEVTEEEAKAVKQARKKTTELKAKKLKK